MAVGQSIGREQAVLALSVTDMSNVHELHPTQ